jgi:hypothetical protein
MRKLNFSIPSVGKACISGSLLAVVAIGLSSQVGQAAEKSPWTDTFTMALGGKERLFATYQGSPYLIIDPNDASNASLLLGRKDVVVVAKFERDGVSGTRQRLKLSNLPGVIAEGDAQLFATRLEGDNLYFFGSLTMDEKGGRLEVRAIEVAPSDAQIIAQRIADLKPDDYAGRLKAANDIRERTRNHPNKEFWLSAADNIVAQVIDDAAAAAEQTKDAALLNQAVTWSIEILKDPTKAGRIASATWLHAPGVVGTEDITKRMRRLGLEIYKDEWRPRAEALSMEFEDRFAALLWKDADGFYKLGRWADLHGDFLPRSRDRSYRCYQAGYRANPNHPGIRNELGLPSQAGGSNGAAITADYQHVPTGTLVQAPQGWKRGERIEGDITWTDPNSETAYIAATVSEAPANLPIDTLWANAITSQRAKTDFQLIEEDEPLFPQGLAKRARFTFREGRYLRHHEMLLAYNPQARVAVRLDASFAEEESSQVHTTLLSTFDRLVIPNIRPGSASVPPPTNGPGPQGGPRPPGGQPPIPPRGLAGP